MPDPSQLLSNVYFVVGGSCAPVPGVIQRDYFAHCANLPGILSDLVRRENVKSVVLGASWAGYTSMLIERGCRQLPLNTTEGQSAFYANLEDYVRSLQSLGSKVYIVLGLPIHGRFNPNLMVTRGLTSVRVASDAGQSIPIAALRATNAIVDAELQAVAARTGATLLDTFPDVCGSANDCSPFFGAREPKFSDGMHLRLIFVRDHLLFLDFLLK